MNIGNAIAAKNSTRDGKYTKVSYIDIC